MFHNFSLKAKHFLLHFQGGAPAEAAVAGEDIAVDVTVRCHGHTKKNFTLQYERGLGLVHQLSYLYMYCKCTYLAEMYIFTHMFHMFFGKHMKQGVELMKVPYPHYSVLSFWKK